MTRLAAIATAMLLAAGCAFGSHHSSTPPLNRHYFNIGERACRPQDGGTDALFNPAVYPLKYRKAIRAGCAAAVKGGIQRTTSALHKHYFLVGERECRRQMRQQHGADALVIVRANQPPGYVQDVEAGCKAAIGF